MEINLFFFTCMRVKWLVLNKNDSNGWFQNEIVKGKKSILNKYCTYDTVSTCVLRHHFNVFYKIK